MFEAFPKASLLWFPESDSGCIGSTMPRVRVAAAFNCVEKTSKYWVPASSYAVFDGNPGISRNPRCARLLLTMMAVRLPWVVEL